MSFRRSFVLLTTCGCLASFDVVHLSESCHSIHSRSQEACNQFTEWLTAQGSDMSRIEIRSTQDHFDSFGVFVKGSLGLRSMLPWNKKLAVFPYTLALTSTVATKDHLIGLEIQEFVKEKKLSPSGVLALYIALQRELGSRSLYLPWIKMLPNEVNTPLLYSADQLQELKGTPLYKAVQVIKVKLRREWDHIKSHGLREMCEKLNVKKCPTFDDYLWATGIVWSRSFELPQSLDPETNDFSHSFEHCLSIVPGLDFFNHSNTPSCSLRINSNESKPQIQLEMAFGVWSLDQELTLTYGDKSNEELLYGYGFTLDFNPLEQLTLLIPFAMKANDERQKMQLLRQLNISPRITLTKVALQEAMRMTERNKLDSILTLIPEQTWSLFELQNLSAEELETIDAAQFQASMEFPSTNEWLARVNAFKVFLQAIQADLESNNGTGTLEEDILLLEKLNETRNTCDWKRHCIIYRSVQKKMTRDWIKILSLLVNYLTKTS